MKKKKQTLIEYEVWRTIKGSFCPENCWCRGIITVPKKGRGRYFIDPSWINKEQAELIVTIHNEWLSNL